MNQFNKIHFSSAASKHRKIKGELRFDYAVVNIEVDSKNKPFTDFQIFFNM